MSSSLQTDKFVDKVELIYKYDKKTPLFVRQADTELNRNNAETALSIVLEGLKIYPYSPTGYIVLGKCFSRLGKYEDAEKAYRIGSEIIFSLDTLKYYLSELEDIRKHKQAFSINKRKTFVEAELTSIKKPAPRVVQDKDAQSLEDLAERISRAKIPVPSQETVPTPAASEETEQYANVEIVSETLAKILESQGNSNEALRMYQKLIKKHPERTEFYLQKIQYLAGRLTGT